MSFKEYLRKRAAVHGNFYVPSGSPTPTDHKYNAIAREGYEYNPYVRACVDLIANTAASLRPKLYNYNENGDKQEIRDAELMKLFMHPNPDEGAFAFKQRMFSYYLLGDECYIQKVTTKGKQPNALNLMQPDTVKVLSGGATNPIGSFEVNVKDRGAVKLRKDEVIYVKGFNPSNITAGSPTAFGASYAIDTSNEMMKYNLRNMQNGGTPPFQILGARTQREVDNIMDLWDSVYAGSGNAGKPFVPMSDTRIERMGMTNQEAQWLEGIKLSGDLIMMTFGIQPELLMGGSNRASYEQAFKSMYIQAVLPMWQMFLDAFNNHLTPLYADRGQHLMLEIDRNNIDALSEDKNEVHKRVRQDFLAGVATRKEVREIVGYDPDMSGDTGDAFQQPVNVIFVGEEGEIMGEMEDTVGNNVNDADPNPDDDAIADR